MKKIASSIGFILAITAFSAQATFTSPIAIETSTIKKEEREVKNFKGIATGGPIHVVVTIGNTESLRFEGDAEAIATLITEVKENVLIIRPQNSWVSWARKYENKKITAYVTAKSVTSLTISGSGSINVNGKITAQNFVATLSGSGYISADVDTEDFTGVISGSGKLNFSGKTENATLTISGSGSFAEKGFATNHLTAVISGSGTVNMEVDDSINAVISGSGNINYSGNATVEKRTMGSGKVRKI